MEFNVLERLQLLGATAHLEGNLVTLRVVRDLRAALSFSEEELSALDFKQENEQINWNAQAAVPKTVEVGPAAKAAVSRAFKQLDERGNLTLDLLPLAERFLEA